MERGKGLTSPTLGCSSLTLFTCISPVQQSALCYKFKPSQSKMAGPSDGLSPHPIICVPLREDANTSISPALPPVFILTSFLTPVEPLHWTTTAWTCFITTRDGLLPSQFLSQQPSSPPPSSSFLRSKIHWKAGQQNPAWSDYKNPAIHSFMQRLQMDVVTQQPVRTVVPYSCNDTEKPLILVRFLG